MLTSVVPEYCQCEPFTPISHFFANESSELADLAFYKYVLVKPLVLVSSNSCQWFLY
ncbi:hypothetical protein CIPAW_14G094100 [Carya illinoinensis]|uniref:Uncharacterized protein n=1 Tax=Carya illinoinensis TaxID=32201 RepID=A0A8T1NL21_CARIL|nr:hypothetical protein CIPAW_14G094100 [Carya illinoinensis]